MRVNIDLGRHGPFHNVKLEGKEDDPILCMEVPKRATLCMTAAGAEKFANDILSALETAGLRSKSSENEIDLINSALMNKMLDVTESGLVAARTGTFYVDKSLGECNKIPFGNNSEEVLFSEYCSKCEREFCKIQVVSDGKIMKFAPQKIINYKMDIGFNEEICNGIANGLDVILLLNYKKPQCR